MDKERIVWLFRKYLQKTATPEERAELFALLYSESIDTLSRLQDPISPADIPDELFTRLSASSSRRIFDEILARGEEGVADEGIRQKRRSRVIWLRAAAAAVVLLILGSSLYYISQQQNKKMLVAEKIGGANDRKPGHQGAVLSLSNGQTIILDTAHNGLLADGFTKSSEAVQVKDVVLSSATSSAHDGKTNGVEPAYATLSTPAGRQQKLVLSDGTVVYLNASSSISFPTVFGKGQRQVTIKGEVYFDVVHDAQHPFVVKAGDDEIRDIGTRFNINAYPDEPGIKTTLVEGCVQINDRYVLKPGDQYSEGQIRKVDTDAATAWMSGFFHFEHDDVSTVMRQIARWYDISVTYEGAKPTQKFGGDIQRNLMLSEVLELLGGTGVDYKLSGNKLIIKSR